MQYHTDRFSVFFGNKTNGLEVPSERGAIGEEEACVASLTQTVSRSIVSLQSPLRLPVMLLEQVHGVAIHTIKSCDDYPSMALRSREGDGLITTVPCTAVGMLTADCLPVVLYRHDTHALCIVHAGWRGITQGIISQAIEQMGINSSNATIVLGPSARGCCYEVGEDFLSHIPETHGQSLQQRNNHSYFDLHAYARQELALHNLAECIVRAEQACTICDTNFYSYRREGRACVQRQVTIAVLHN